MRAAAEHLTPVTLELGGKSPAIVEPQREHRGRGQAASRWGKFLNAGQTCIAPDYVLVETPVHDQLVTALGDAVREFYGDDPAASPDFGRIVDDAHFPRLEKLLHAGEVVIGGDADPDRALHRSHRASPGCTATTPPWPRRSSDRSCPCVAVDSVDEAIAGITDRRQATGAVRVQRGRRRDRPHRGTTPAAAACASTARCLHISNPHLPFGGVGESGTGAYHGRHGFDAFSHHKAVHTRSTRLDPPLLYPPYTETKAKMIRIGLGAPDPRDLVAGLRNRLRRS